MIGKISGLLDYVAEDHALIDANGVGYIVYAGAQTLARLPASGEKVALYTELVVRQDLMQLFGFSTLLEKEWHRLLTSVQGVGAKASMTILDTLGAEGVGRAITLGDATAIKAAPGIGPKLAQRVVNELKNKAPNIRAFGAKAAAAAIISETLSADATLIEPAGNISEAPSISDSAQADAVSALTNLGVSPADAVAATAAAAKENPAAETSELIKTALKRLGSSLL